MAWCRHRWPDQCSAKARRAREISPAAYCLARPASRAVSAIDSLIGAMPGGQGWPPRTGTGASPREISRSASLISPSSTVSLVSCPVPGSWMWPVSALRMAAARSWARAARAVWRQMPFQLRAWAWAWSHRQPGRGQPVQLPHRELRLGGELQVPGDPGGPPARHVPRPAVRHVHIEVRPCLPARGDVGGEHGG